MYIFNATNELQSVKALGNWFTFKPKQIRQIDNQDLAMFLLEERADHGLVGLPEAFEDLEYRGSAEGKKALEKYEEQGINSYVRALRAVIYNNQVSMRQDLEKSNLKIDPAALASDGELAAMRLVAKYQKDSDDRDQRKIDEVKQLVKQSGTGSK